MERKLGQHITSHSIDLRKRLKRAAYLWHLLETFEEGGDPLHNAPLWEDWLARTGELPPDFDALPPNAFLPDLLTLDDGTAVRTPADWEARRCEVLAVLQRYQLGTWPPPPPRVLAEEMDEERDETQGGMLKRVRLVFGPRTDAVAREAGVAWRDFSMYRAAQLAIEVFVPDGEGPFPALVGMGYRHGGRLVDRLRPHAAHRGYVVCLLDMVDAFAAKEAYPACDCNEIVWWAYAASRCADYLRELGCVDANRIAVAGHSRGGKMAVVAAALDSRFAAAIASHPGAGTGAVAPWRYLGEKFGGETLEYSTRCYPYWNHPRLRFFAGRENRLPFDSHFLLALIAPRPLLITEGDADDVDECWGGQQAYLAVRRVYEVLGHPREINLVFHAGGHHLSPEALEAYVDWLDMRFGRRPLSVCGELMYTYTFEKWCEVTGEHIDPLSFPERGLDDLLLTAHGVPVRSPRAWAGRREEITDRALWALGEPLTANPVSPALANVQSSSEGLVKAELPIEGKLVAHLTYPARHEGKLPVAIYLHAYLDSLGHAWSAEYGWSPSVAERLAQCGFLAVEYDQLGYGSRNHESGIEFYATHPRQSAMGVMVQDVHTVLDALSILEIADRDRIVVAGFSLGGAVAIHAAALDERIKAVASVSGFASMRLDVHGDQTEGLRRYSHLRPTLPRLGFFVGHESRVPYDYHELLALIAPRPVFILAPRLDQDWFLEDVQACHDAALAVYRLLGAADNLRLETPNDFNRYPPRYQQRVNTWLVSHVGRLAT